MPAYDIPGVGRIAMVTDPDGAPFYLMTPAPPAGRPDAESDVCRRWHDPSWPQRNPRRRVSAGRR